MEPRLLVVGGGRMGAALVKGLRAAGWAPEAFTVVEVDAPRRAELAGELPGVAVVAEPVRAGGAVISVKPAAGERACRAVSAVGVPRLLSIMAGVPLHRLQSWSGPDVAIVRAMPNTPALVGAGMSAVSGGPAVAEADLAWAEELLGAVGEVVRVPETALDAVTGVSGSGPAYVFFVAEALIDAGVLAGLDRAVSRRLAVQTIVGSARLLATGEEPDALRAQVTSPGGTTAAAVSVLESRALRDAFAEAVAAAVARSREMGEEGP
ncbi:MAG: pyrroline-5-carboxylate reductase [Acidimicrobiales bacterium]